MIDRLLTTAADFVPMLATVAVVAAILALLNWALKRRWRNEADTKFRFQLIMLGLTFAGLLAVVLALPVNDGTRGQLLSLIGILLSAAIALSSTTFIGNIMAGIMLKVVRSARPGDFITVSELTGRITEMGLLHTEVQTELRDLVTVPNLYMVTQPMQVVRSSGTIISTEVSLGYDVPHTDVSRLLTEATASAGLQEGFVHVRQLGDYSVTYRVAGLLQDVKSLISSRARLREATLDALHAAGIEIVSPTFMNTRAFPEGRQFIPEGVRKTRRVETTQVEQVAFDKAEEAASAEEIRKSIALVDSELAELEESEDEASRERLKGKRSRLVEQLKAAEEQKNKRDLEE